VQLFTEYPYWLLSLSGLAGGLYAGLLYYFGSKHTFPVKMVIVLAAIRFVHVFGITALLLNPYRVHLKKETEKPVLLIAHDNSASLLLMADSSYIRGQYAAEYAGFIDKLSQKFTVEPYTFGQSVLPGEVLSFDEQLTDYTPIFKQLIPTYKRRNVVGLVLLSDGLYNQGMNPAFLTDGISFPIYTVILGDTTVHSDLSVFDVRYNKVVYNQTDFTVEISVNATQAHAKQTELKLFLDGKQIEGRPLMITGDRYSETVQFVVKEAAAGHRQIRVSLTPIAGEAVLINNTREFYVEVKNEKQHVLMLAAAPHPDLGAMTSALEGVYETEIRFEPGKPIDQFSYDVLVLHQLPAESPLLRYANTLMSQRPDCPVLYILGPLTNLNMFNSWQSSMVVRAENQPISLDVNGVIDQSFSLFSLDEASAKQIMQFPPLNIQSTGFQPATASSVLLRQKIRGVETNMPLMLFSYENERKTAFICGTGIWRWRQYDYLLNGSHETFTNLMTKSVNYLMTVTDKNPLRVSIRDAYFLNDEIKVTAELYNESMEQVNEPELNIEFTNKADHTNYPFVFNRIDKTYQLNAGRMPQGLYHYTAITSLGNKMLKAEGDFQVLSGSLETREAVARPERLRSLSNKTGGSFTDQHHLDQLADQLIVSDHAKPVVHESRAFDPLIDSVWVLSLIVLLLAAEWLLRKINGGY